MAAVGDQLAHYQIESLLGAGGMGEVYVAFDQTLERRVALKLLPENRAVHAESRLRMLREARAASALAHPGIVTVYEIGEAAGHTYIAMELVEGETLAQLVARRGALPPAEAVALLRQVGDAIVAAHAAGILHRDLKTANLMLDRGGRVKVLDFGLSKRVGAPSQPPASRPAPRRVDPEAETVSGDPSPIDPRGETVTPDLAGPVIVSEGRAPSARESKDVVTVHGARMGTPGSAAPELMDGEDADVRSDVFSLGVVLHELVTGKPPFPWTSWEDIRLRILERRYRRVAEVTPGAIAERLDAVIARALAPSRDDRHATVSELVLAAEAAVRARKPVRWPLVAGAGAVTIAGVTIAALSWPRASSKAPAIDAGPPGPVTEATTLAEPVAITRLGGCAYTPAFVDERTVVFDLTTRERQPDLWTVEVPGGDPVQLTDGIGWEWRAAAGLTPGEVVFLVDDPDHQPGAAKQGIAQIDRATRTIEYLNQAWSPGVAAARGDLYYLIAGGSELRRRRGAIDELVATLPDDPARPEQLAASADGEYLAIAGPPPDVKLMLVELDTEVMKPLPAELPGNARPAFSAIDDAVYYLGAAGIRRIRVDGTGDEQVAALRATGGIAVSPDGAYLLYSDCDQRTQLLDVAVSPPALIIPPAYTSEPTAGPNGWLAWIQQDQSEAVLMVRRPDGRIEQLTTRAVGRVTSPSFDANGEHIAFSVRGGAHPGIQVMALSEDGGTRRMFQVTSSADDLAPMYVGDELVFTRYDASGFPHLMRTPTTGGNARPALEETDLGIGLSVSGNDHVLIGMGPSHAFQMWDPETGKSSRLGLPGELVGTPRFSPNGDWIVVTGDDAVWRLHLAQVGMTVDQATPERLYEIPRDGLAGYATIGDDGHVIVAPSEWSGEIYAVPAPPGTRW